MTIELVRVSRAEYVGAICIRNNAIQIAHALSGGLDGGNSILDYARYK